MYRFFKHPALVPLFLSLTLLALTSALSASAAGTPETQVQFLSGHDKDDAVPWDFYCTAGGRSGRWTTIPVPSNWELHGFGIYTYGVERERMTPKPPSVEGRYKRMFSVPGSWSGRRVCLVFEGVMTDTQVQVNGRSAGPAHQGGFYRFQYDVTKLLKYGQDNLLAVTVTDESGDTSINFAERRGDYWNYGGIYRPVYLEAFPAESIERVAVNAQADGRFAVDVYGDGIATADTVEGRIEDLAGHLVGAPFSTKISAETPVVQLRTQSVSPRLWTAETPNLYQVQIRLKRGATIIHQVRQRFGFRTIELRPGEGIYVNGTHILLKGSNRHSFWPDSGRCLSDKISRLDIGLMKDMNMNAVRMSHYPPDQSFLDDCDSLGLYVLDELGGWQHKYDTETGHRLVGELVVRDVNHPSILFWDNANEGGWNTALDDDYAKWDPQQRPVIHPGGGDFRDDLDDHYPTYARIRQSAAGHEVFMPTEFLHGLYDGGAGSGLADYWDVMRQSKVCGGGFLWAFLDEALKRVDMNGRLDTRGNLAPDGIVGPYREKEGSYETIKQVWSPVVITEGKSLPAGFGGTLHVENRYDFTDLRQCRFVWELRNFSRPGDAQAGFRVAARGTAATASVPPGTTGTLALVLPSGWRGAESLSVRALDPQGRDLWTWAWPLTHADDYRALTSAPSAGQPTETETADAIRVQAGALTVTFSKARGQLISAQRGDQSFSLINGPRPAVGGATLTAITTHTDGTDYAIDATYTGGLKSVQWRIHGNGWLTVDYTYAADGPQDYLGVGFDYPEAKVRALTWLGDGPYRTYKNRRAGGTLNVWHSAYNRTVTGDSLWDYPEFKGYYGDVRWARLQTTEGPITFVMGQDDLFLQVLTSDFPPPSLAGHTIVPFPAADISFLHAIPPMGSKFATAATEGPAGQQTAASGDYHGSVSIYFGDLPH